MDRSAADIPTPPEAGVAAEETGHCEHCEGHHGRIARLEEHLGLTEEQEGEKTPKEEKHEARKSRYERLAKRKRS